MPRAAAGVTLAALGLLVLAATQPWVAGLVEVAPGSVRTRWSASGGELVPWAPAAALAAGAASLVLLARGGEEALGRLLGLLTALGSLAAGAGALLVASGRTEVPAGVVATGPTAWSWVAVVAGAAAAASASAGLVRGVRGPGRRRAGRTAGPGLPRTGSTPDLLPAESRRRQDARAWAELDAGRDPTRDPGAGTMAPAAPAPDLHRPVREARSTRRRTTRSTRPEPPDQEHAMEHENHYHSTAAWVGVGIMLVATVLGCWAAVFGPAWLLWAGLGLFGAGALVWYAMSKAGYGAEAYDAPRPQESSGHRR